MRLKPINKFIFGMTLSLTILGVSSAYAQNEELLAQIVQNTATTNATVTQGNTTIEGTLTTLSGTATSILGALNTQIQNFQQYYVATIFPNLYNFLQSWLAPDNTTATATFQGTFAQLGQEIISEATDQNSLIPQLNASSFGSDPNLNKTVFYYANDLAYSTFLGSPYLSPDPRLKKYPNTDPAYNYLLNASAMALTHIRPYAGAANTTSMVNWKGVPADQQRYQNYYDTIMAISSFNGYVLGNQYEQAKKGNQFTTLQTQLIQEATDSQNWFAQVAGKESLGQILRQLLLFESQSFVLMSESVQLQKQMLTAQVMTNSLLIATNLDKENLMQAYAQGVTPTP